MSRKLISSDESVTSEIQHQEPCSDCPFGKQALNGWLGNASAREWILTAHGDALIYCHVIRNQQCAGAAIYRANVGKLPRDGFALRLKPNKNAVFATPMEFLAHHSRARR